MCNFMMILLISCLDVEIETISDGFEILYLFIGTFLELDLIKSYRSLTGSLVGRILEPDDVIYILNIYT